MEHRVNTLEKWAGKQGSVIAELKSNMMTVKESLFDLKEIKEMLKDFKKLDKNSEGGENSMNGEDKKGMKF